MSLYKRKAKPQESPQEHPKEEPPQQISPPRSDTPPHSTESPLYRYEILHNTLPNGLEETKYEGNIPPVTSRTTPPTMEPSSPNENDICQVKQGTSPISNWPTAIIVDKKSSIISDDDSTDKQPKSPPASPDTAPKITSINTMCDDIAPKHSTPMKPSLYRRSDPNRFETLQKSAVGKIDSIYDGKPTPSPFKFPHHLINQPEITQLHSFELYYNHGFAKRRNTDETSNVGRLRDRNYGRDNQFEDQYRDDIRLGDTNLNHYPPPPLDPYQTPITHSQSTHMRPPPTPNTHPVNAIPSHNSLMKNINPDNIIQSRVLRVVFLKIETTGLESEHDSVTQVSLIPIHFMNGIWEKRRGVVFSAGPVNHDNDDDDDDDDSEDENDEDEEDNYMEEELVRDLSKEKVVKKIENFSPKKCAHIHSESKSSCPEESILSRCIEYLESYQPDIIAGHNILNFDIKFIQARWKLYGQPIDIFDKKKYQGRKHNNINNINNNLVEIWDCMNKYRSHDQTKFPLIFSDSHMDLRPHYTLDCIANRIFNCSKRKIPEAFFPACLDNVKINHFVIDCNLYNINLMIELFKFYHLYGFGGEHSNEFFEWCQQLEQ
jgi:DNA polymerase elongation subunit (family B)